ncbi:MAG TPA: exo-beta-N-acetylmuramidase NamZ domain-containing protein, partial [Vicinamibacteria bacterium]|nr:exo-beta-N-acetylmuramidase NamZ domain-containing protein [Vicinamibacteria bacterium]
MKTLPARGARLRGERVRTGLETLLARPGALKGLRIGLVANPASVNAELVHASLLLRASPSIRLVALFGPEHGIWANAQDLVEVEDGRDPVTGLPVHSLYGRTRVPTEEMLHGIDALVVDLQDVGARYYTFVYTMLHALEACARFGKRLVVLDRPNPLGGLALEGNVLDPA